MKILTSFLFIITFLVSCGDQDQSNETFSSDQGLSQEHKKEFKKDLIEVTEDIYVGVGYGLANSIMIETENSLVIVDTLGSVERAEELYQDFREISEKPIAAIVYTHNHLDHLGGATVFYNENETEIYAQENIIYNLDNIATTIRPIIFQRSARQFGIPLPEEEIVHQGIGGFLEINDQETLGLVRPTILFDDSLTIEIDNLKIVLAHVPGETDDHLYVWIPEKQAVMVGDNFYRSFANLYAIRGTKFRNPMEWVDSLDRIRLLNAEHLVPSHSRPISGKENVEKALTDYRDGIQFVHDQTIRYINKGLTPDEIVQKVKLPKHLAESPYLQPFYGSISSYVRSTFSGYIGWFSGNISDLHPLTVVERAQNTQAKNIKAEAADQLARFQLASNDYYFYKTVAGELRNEIDVNPSTPNRVTSEQLQATPMKAIMKSLPVNLNADKSVEITKKYEFRFIDSEEVYTIHIRKGVAQLSKIPDSSAEVKVITDHQTLKEVFAGLKNVAAISLLLANNTIEVEGGKLEFLKFLGLFTD